MPAAMGQMSLSEQDVYAFKPVAHAGPFLA